MSPIRAVIIAGGAGERLGGVRKADLRIGGVRQIERTIAALGNVATPILVSTGPKGSALAVPAGCIGVEDLKSERGGPLSGLVAAVAYLSQAGITEGLLVSAAVDTPLLPDDFARHMAERLVDSPAGFATWGEDFYPPNAIWRIEALQDLPARIGQNAAPGSLKALQRSLNAVQIDFTDAAKLNPFANFNTLADLIALQRRVWG